jgi:hypothetical protein
VLVVVVVQQVVAFCKLVLSSLEQHMNQVPHMLAVLVYNLLKELLKKFPNDKYTALSGFFLLRFLCPAIAAPQNYRIIAPSMLLDRWWLLALLLGD